MDNSTLALVALGMVILAGLAFFAVFRGRGKASFKAPLGVEASFEGSNEVPPATSRVGSATAEDVRAGGSVRVTAPGDATARRIDAGGDVTVRSEPGPKA